MAGPGKLRAKVAKGIGWRLSKAGSYLQKRGAGERGRAGATEAESYDAALIVRSGWKAPDVDVVFYFPDTVSKIYQLQQWLPVIAAHETELNYAIVTRSKSTWLELMKGDLPAPSFLAPSFVSMMELYRVLAPKAIIYPNNGLRNFQSLIYSDAVHIHVNHGESDKVSMVSNQAKAYDRVFVAGEAAVRRHRAALVDMDEKRLIRVGRPQLDLDPEPTLDESARRTILYAPTWEGEDESNNFTSLDVYGVQLVESVLSIPHTRFIYKPHPRVVTSINPEIAEVHAQIVSLIAMAAEADPDAGHEYRESGDILALFPRVDLLISDVSSVGLDFLYSRAQAPIVLTDRRSDREQLLREAPISAGAHVLDQTSVATTAADISAILARDGNRERRLELRRFYFDDVAPGESTKRFYDALGAAIADHQEGLARARELREQGTWMPADAREGASA